MDDLVSRKVLEEFWGDGLEFKMRGLSVGMDNPGCPCLGREMQGDSFPPAFPTVLLELRASRVCANVHGSEHLFGDGQDYMWCLCLLCFALI